MTHGTPVPPASFPKPFKGGLTLPTTRAESTKALCKVDGTNEESGHEYFDFIETWLQAPSKGATDKTDQNHKEFSINQVEIDGSEEKETTPPTSIEVLEAQGLEIISKGSNADDFLNVTLKPCHSTDSLDRTHIKGAPPLLTQSDTFIVGKLASETTPTIKSIEQINSPIANRPLQRNQTDEAIYPNLEGDIAGNHTLLALQNSPLHWNEKSNPGPTSTSTPRKNSGKSITESITDFIQGVENLQTPKEPHEINEDHNKNRQHNQSNLSLTLVPVRDDPKNLQPSSQYLPFTQESDSSTNKTHLNISTTTTTNDGTHTVSQLNGEITERVKVLSTSHNSIPSAREVGDQLVASVTPIKNGTTEITLSPAELGKVRLIVSGLDQGMVIAISAEKTDTQDLFRRNVDQLAQDFKMATGQDVSFSFEEHSQRQNQEKLALAISQEVQNASEALPSQSTLGSKTINLSTSVKSLNIRL